jgi:hypothetical protein
LWSCGIYYLNKLHGNTLITKNAQESLWFLCLTEIVSEFVLTDMPPSFLVISECQTHFPPNAASSICRQFIWSLKLEFYDYSTFHFLNKLHLLNSKFQCILHFQHKEYYVELGYLQMHLAFYNQHFLQCWNLSLPDMWVCILINYLFI